MRWIVAFLVCVCCVWGSAHARVGDDPRDWKPSEINVVTGMVNGMASPVEVWAPWDEGAYQRGVGEMNMLLYLESQKQRQGLEIIAGYVQRGVEMLTVLVFLTVIRLGFILWTDIWGGRRINLGEERTLC